MKITTRDLTFFYFRNFSPIYSRVNYELGRVKKIF